MSAAEAAAALDSVREGTGVCTKAGNGTVVKRQGMRLRVEVAGGTSKWFELKDLLGVEAAHDHPDDIVRSGVAAPPRPTPTVSAGPMSFSRPA